MDIKIVKTTTPKEKPDQNKLGFGTYFTDHMFIMDYDAGQGWHDPRIVPYGPISLDPAATVLHYGQAVFEGLKAYRAKDGRVLLFRPNKNMERINTTNDRMCIPRVDEEFMVNALKTLVRVDEEWIPQAEGTSLYIRPFIIGTDPKLGVHPSNHYLFIVILSPVGAYYPEGINPVKIYVEPYYVRTVKGGTGFAKAAANYAVSLKAQVVAEEKGYTQVLWLDGVEKKYIEEVGTMNVFFQIGDEVITPELGGSILPGITRYSTIDLLKSWGYNVSERRLSIQEVYEAHQNGTLKEVFGTGTAAVISPVGELIWEDKHLVINHNQTGPLSKRIYDTITGIQSGTVEDTFHWTVEVMKK